MKRLRTFAQKDYGGIIFLSIAAAEAVLAVMLFFSDTISRDMLKLGLEIGTVLLGAGYVAGYYANARSRFRPCWYLSFGLLLMLAGVLSLLIDRLAFHRPAISAVAVVMALAAVNFSLCTATALQLKALCLARWLPILLFGILNAAYGAAMYFNVFSARDNSAVCMAIYCILLALQTAAEAFYNIRIETHE